jgi:hypothetical protein
VNGHGDVIERKPDRRLGLVKSDLDLIDAGVIEAQLGDTLGHRLDEISWIFAYCVGDLRREQRVVNRLRKVVRLRGCPGVDPEDDIDHEGLTVGALVRVDTVVTKNPEPPKGDQVRHYVLLPVEISLA